MKFFSVVVVSLNSGERLKKTLQSILNQTFSDYEVIIKDGGSKDGSLDFLSSEHVLEKYPQIRLIQEKDRSIYDGMNQAVTYVSGRYVQFLNCGDLFYDENVLRNVADYITEYFRNEKETTEGIHAAEDVHLAVDEGRTDSGVVSIDAAALSRPMIFYGNQYNLIQKTIVTSAPQMNDFACFRNVPCHQVCFYDSCLFEKRAYLPEYTVRADYEHFLHCIYEENAHTKAMPIVICMYEGGGYSETKENRKKSAVQHREITDKYLGKKAVKYRWIMRLSMAGIRTKIAENPVLSKPYNALKSLLYKR